jgi:hypothetical protein
LQHGKGESYTRRSKKPLFIEGAVDGRLQHVLRANCNSVIGHLQHHQKTEKSPLADVSVEE